jgi:hypothetical protein
VEANQLRRGEHFQQPLLLGLEQARLFLAELEQSIEQRPRLRFGLASFQQHCLHASPHRGLLSGQLHSIALEGPNDLPEAVRLDVSESQALPNHLAEAEADPTLEIGPAARRHGASRPRRRRTLGK